MKLWMVGWAVLVAELIAVLWLGWLYSRHAIVIAVDKGADIATLVLAAATLVLTGVAVAVAVVTIWGFREIRARAIEASVKAALDAMRENARKPPTPHLRTPSGLPPAWIAKKEMEPRTTFDVISEHSRSAPVDVERIAAHLGIRIYREPLEPGVYGKLAHDLKSPSEFSIYVNRSDSWLRQRFTIAHEIAHFVLHRDLITEEVVDKHLYRSHLGNRYESQANRFAAGLLMPSELVTDAFNNTSKDVALLARKFRVSRIAMKIRLESLGLVEKSQQRELSERVNQS